MLRKLLAVASSSEARKDLMIEYRSHRISRGV